MGDRANNSIEVGREHIPSSEEVRALFVEITGGNKFVETQKREDERGLYRWDIEVPTADGGKKEYLYERKGKYPTGDQAAETAIHVTEYDSDGMPCGGSSVMKCDEHGVWRRTP